MTKVIEDKTPIVGWLDALGKTLYSASHPRPLKENTMEQDTLISPAVQPDEALARGSMGALQAGSFGNEPSGHTTPFTRRINVGGITFRPGGGRA